MCLTFGWPALLGEFAHFSPYGQACSAAAKALSAAARGSPHRSMPYFVRQLTPVPPRQE
jgi:hypothetical protein